jgi:hypothetical protein
MYAQCHLKIPPERMSFLYVVDFHFIFESKMFILMFCIIAVSPTTKDWSLGQN